MSSLTIFSLGLVIGIYFANEYRKTGKELMPHVSLMGFCLAMFYSGGTFSFISILATGVGLPVAVAGTLSYCTVPVGILLGMYLGFSIFRPELTRRVVLVFGATAVVFYVALFGFPALFISGNEPTPENPFTDTGLRSVLLYMAIFYIASVVGILCTGFYKLSKKLEGEEKQKCVDLFWGWLLFSVAQVVEIVILSEYILVPRVVTFTSFFLIFRGFRA
ncbi:MAG: hypothetical protein ACTSU5_11515 [Promethearchaeota archaeon]